MTQEFNLTSRRFLRTKKNRQVGKGVDTCGVQKTHNGVVGKRSMSHSPKSMPDLTISIEIAGFGVGCAKHGGSHRLSQTFPPTQYLSLVIAIRRIITENERSLSSSLGSTLAGCRRRRLRWRLSTIDATCRVDRLQLMVQTSRL